MTLRLGCGRGTGWPRSRLCRVFVYYSRGFARWVRSITYRDTQVHCPGYMLSPPSGVLDYWIRSGRLGGLGSSRSDHFGPLSARSLPAGLPDGADPAPGVQGRRAIGGAARERGSSPPGQPGPLSASRPAVVRGAVAADPATQVGRGVHGDPGDPAQLAPAAGCTHMGLQQPAGFRAAVHGSRDQEARDPHRDGEPHVGAPARARRTHQARPPDRRFHGLADPA